MMNIMLLVRLSYLIYLGYKTIFYLERIYLTEYVALDFAVEYITAWITC